MWGLAAWAHGTLRLRTVAPVATTEMRPSPRERGAPPELGVLIADCAHKGNRTRSDGRTFERLCQRRPELRPADSSMPAFLAWLAQFPERDVDIDEIDSLYATICDLSGWEAQRSQPEPTAQAEPAQDQPEPACLDVVQSAAPAFVRRHRRLKDDAHADIIALLEAGHTPESQDWLALRWGVSKGAVSRWITAWEESSGVNMRRLMRYGRSQVLIGHPEIEEEVPWSDLPAQKKAA